MPDTIDDVLYGDAKFAVVCGDATAVLKTIPSDIIAVCYCDPPYGLSTQNTSDVVACLTAWLAGDVYTHRGPGFLGANWDAFVPGPETWREVHRVLKPGAYCVAFSSTRTVDLLGMAMRLSGLEPRNGWAWITGQGFPKNLDVGKALGKMAGAREGSVGTLGTDAAKQWEGWGTDVKPSYEPLMVTRKPIDGTVAQNVLTHGAGALNIDGTRVRYEETPNPATNPLHRKLNGYENRNIKDGNSSSYQLKDGTGERNPNPGGRFPSSIALIHDEGCTFDGTRRVQTGTPVCKNRDPSKVRDSYRGGFKNPTSSVGYAATDGFKATGQWNCTDTCAVRVLDQQSGQLTSGTGAAIRTHKPRATIGKESRPVGAEIHSYGDTGAASRFFYQGKANSSDRLAYLTCSPGCIDNNTVSPVRQANHVCPTCSLPTEVYLHPTVKPYELALYHAKLLSLPPHTQPVALVPFCGTGVEARALLDVGFKVIAVDIDPRHVAMTLFRLRGGNTDPAKTVTMEDLLGI